MSEEKTYRAIRHDVTRKNNVKIVKKFIIQSKKRNKLKKY